MINEDEIREKINRFIDEAHGTDYVFDGEDEVLVDCFNEYGLADSIVEYITSLLEGGN